MASTSFKASPGVAKTHEVLASPRELNRSANALDARGCECHTSAFASHQAATPIPALGNAMVAAYVRRIDGRGALAGRVASGNQLAPSDLS
mmetsp:Transcript_7856/g.20387  ORF Transcript_7856/g.20387 Transcript_7856/m.20387 type:complete len:91 (-) Transcript_7856:329-601(-)